MGDYKGKLSGLALEVFDPAPVVVVVTTGAEHRLVYTNAAFQRTFGEAPKGEPLRAAFANLVERGYFGLFDKVWSTGETVQSIQAPVTVRPSGTASPLRYFFTFSISTILLEGGERGVLLVAMEVTGQAAASERADVLAEERRRALLRYQSLVRVGTQMVWVTDPQGVILEMSEETQEVLGRSREDLNRFGWLDSIHPEDRIAVAAAWKEARERELALFECTCRMRTADGSFRHFQLRAVPVREDGAIVEWVGTSTDTEQEWQERGRAELLARAAAAKDAVGRDELFNALAQVIVPTLADGCGVYLLPDPADRPTDAPIVAYRTTKTVRQGLFESPPRRQERFAPDSMFARAVRRRRPMHRVFPNGEPPPGAAPPGTEKWMAGIGANSLVLLPIVVNGDVAAVVHAVSCGDRPPITEADISLIGQILDHARAPLSKLMELQRSQRIARAMQRSLLSEPPEVPGLEIVARYRPSRAAGEIGGDWYDSFVLHDGALALTIGDVSGHDISAAVTMSQYRNMLRGLAIDREEPPGEILRRLDRAIQALYDEVTATCVLARVEKQENGQRWLNYCVAGHPPPLLVAPGGKCRFLEGAHTPLLGVDAATPRHSAVEPLPPLSTLLLYTDGLVEHPSEHLDEGLDRLCRHAESLACAPVDAFCDELLAELAVTERDDIAMVAVRLPAEPDRKRPDREPKEALFRREA